MRNNATAINLEDSTMAETCSLMITRLKKEMERRGVNARELADEAKVGRSFVYDILSGKSANPTSRKLSALADVLGVSLPYLVDGTVNDNDAEAVSGGRFIAVLSVEEDRIVSGDIEAVHHTSGPPYFFEKKWIKEHLKSHYENLRVIYVFDDSMRPLLHRGDVMLVDLGKVSPTPPGIFLIHDGVGIIPRRLEAIPGAEKPRVKISAGSNGFADHEQDLSSLRIVGRVMWFARTL